MRSLLARRHVRRITATICLTVFATGCGEQAVGLVQQNPAESQYELVNYGPRLTLTIGHKVMPLHGLHAAAMQSREETLAAYRAFAPADRQALREMVLFMMAGDSSGMDSLRTTLLGEAWTLHVGQRTPNGLPYAYRVGNARGNVAVALSPALTQAAVTVTREGQETVTLTATPSDGTGGSFQIRQPAGSASAVVASSGSTLASQLHAVQPRGIEPPEPGEGASEEAWLDWCGARAGAILAGLLAAIATGLIPTTEAGAAALETALESFLNLTGFQQMASALGAIAGLIGAVIEWVEMWPSTCQEKYGTVWNYMSDHDPFGFFWAAYSTATGQVTEWLAELRRYRCSHWPLPTVCPE